jgi:hopene-associated glycosyltransferase HpnB
VVVLGIVCVASALAWVYLLAAHGGFWLTSQRLPVITGPVGPGQWPAIVAVVPARNEADMLPLTLPSLLAQDYPGDFRVTLVDDGSGDGTGRVAAGLGAPSREGDGRRAPLTVVPGRPRPDGWAGKVWAMHQGLEASSPPGMAASPRGGSPGGAAPRDSSYVLFTDADIEWAPGALRDLVAAAERDNRALVSQMALLRARTGWEKVIVPAFVYFFAQLYPFRRVASPSARTAAGAGGCMLIRRAALRKAGGLEPVKGALIDDVAIGTLLKRDGNRIWLGLTTDIRSVRPYPRLADLWHMIARSAYVQLRYSPLLLAGTVIGLLFLYAAPPAGLLTWAAATAGGNGKAAALAGVAGLAGWALMSRTYIPMLRLYRLSALRAPSLPLIAILYAGMTADSARRHHTGRAVSWRGRAASRAS